MLLLKRWDSEGGTSHRTGKKTLAGDPTSVGKHEAAI